MVKAELHGIKRAGALGIFKAIADGGRVCRADVAKSTGLSLMTVGKVVDALLDTDVLTQEKDTRHAAGRRAGVVSLNRDYYAVVLDLSERAFRMNIVDVSLTHTDSFTHNYSDEFTYRDNLLLFLKNAAAAISDRADADKLIGVGICVPGIYKRDRDVVISDKIPDMDTVRLCETAESVLGRPVSVVMKSVEAAALSNVRSMDGCGHRTVIYMFMGETIDGAVYNRDQVVKGAHGFECDFGRMVLRHGELLESRIARCRSDAEICSELSSAIYNIITIIDPDAFIIESDRLREPDMLISEIKSSLAKEFHLPHERMPEFIAGSSSLRHSARGVAMSLRESWMESII